MELLIVMIIVAIMMAITLPSLTSCAARRAMSRFTSTAAPTRTGKAPPSHLELRVAPPCTRLSSP